MLALQAGAPALAQVIVQVSPTAPRYHTGATVGVAEGVPPSEMDAEGEGVLVRVPVSDAVGVRVIV